MAPMFWSGWLEVALAGLVVAIAANRGLSVREGAGLCATALTEGAPGGGGRAAILRATCAASDAAWAQLVRGALREPALDAPIAADAGYRDAPRRTLSESVTRIAQREEARLRRRRALGLGGAAAALGSGAILLRAQPVALALVMLAAAVSAWRVLVNARRATTALDETRRALPDLVASVAPPPAPEALAVEPSPVALRSGAGCFGGIFVVGFGFIVVILGGGVLSELRHSVPADQIGLLLGVHVLVSPIAFALVMMLGRVDARIDVSTRELVVLHRLLGRTVERTTVPLEIVASFFVKGRRPKRLCADTVHHHRPREPAPETSFEIVDGDLADDAAAALNRALGRTGWTRSRT